MKAIYPGSFDPFTLGHKVIVEKSLKMFGSVVIAIGINDKKSGFITVEKRIELINRIYGNDPRVEVLSYKGLTIDFCKENNIGVIIRGVRNFIDFEYERSISNINNSLSSDIDTVLILTPPEVSDISSSVVRELLFHGRMPSEFLPPEFTVEDFQTT